jgi:ParB-like chromosome segregation protein Spo0J
VAQADDVAVRIAPLDAFRPNAANPRVHDKRNLDAIGASIDQFGPGRSLVAGPNGTIYCGNGTYAEAVKRGMEALVVRPRRNQIVVVDREDLSPTEATSLAIVDNRATDLSSNDDEVLLALLASLPEAERRASGFTDAEYRALLSEMEKAEEAAEVVDEAPTAAVLTPWLVVVHCRDEEHQAQLIGRFRGEGLTCVPYIPDV